MERASCKCRTLLYDIVANPAMRVKLARKTGGTCISNDARM
jgi:hypothetical protein